MARSIPQLPGYEIAGRVGEGAGAVICRAVKRLSREAVAIKHVDNSDGEQEKFIVQAENEYEIAHELDHPYLRKYHDIVRVKNWRFKVKELFLVMEYVDGERLEDRVPPELTDRVRVFIDVADALHAMHKAGYVHADIKPNNIMLLANGHVKVIDFGQSCKIGHRKERIQGTPDYIAPEQLNRHPLDPRTDVYNLGATMYQVFTGKHYETLMSVAEPGVPKLEVDKRRDSLPPDELNPDIPKSLSKLIMECVSTVPDERPDDMRKVISRLETALHTLEGRKEPSMGKTGLAMIPPTAIAAAADGPVGKLDDEIFAPDHEGKFDPEEFLTQGDGEADI